MYNSQFIFIFKIQSLHLFILIVHARSYNRSHINRLNEESMVCIIKVTLLSNQITFLHSPLLNNISILHHFSLDK